MTVRKILAALIITAGLAAYANSLTNPFIWDDEYLITVNPYVKSWHHVLQIFTSDVGGGSIRHYCAWRPLQGLTYLCDHTLWGLNPLGYHLTNTLIHIAVALAVGYLVMLLFSDLLLAFLTALLFVLHPVHTEAVTYIAGHADPLAALGILLAFIFYIRYRLKPRKSTEILIYISYLCALLSREHSIILIPLLLVYHYAFRTRLLVRQFAMLAGMAVLYLIVRTTCFPQLLTHTKVTTTMLERLPGFFIAFAGYIRILLLPFGLHMEYGNMVFPVSFPLVPVGAVLFLLTLLCVYLARKQRGVVLFALLWFLTALFPFSNIYPINAFMAEHWLYLPSVGYFLLIAYGLIYLYRNRHLPITAAGYTVILIAFYAFLTFRQNTYWKDPAAFYEHTAEFSMDSTRPYNNLGSSYKEQGKITEAIEAYKKSIALSPMHVEPYYNLGVLYQETGKYAEALPYYQKTLELDPKHVQAATNMGTLYNQMGKTEEAIAAYKKALAIDPRYGTARVNLALVYSQLGRTDEAVACYRDAIAADPEYADAYINLGTLYKDTGRMAEAAAALQKATALDPQNVKAYNTLGMIYMQSGEYAQAAQVYEKAQKADTRNPALLYNLAVVYFYLQKYDRAIASADAAVRLGFTLPPEFVRALAPYRHY